MCILCGKNGLGLEKLNVKMLVLVKSMNVAVVFQGKMVREGLLKVKNLMRNS